MESWMLVAREAIRDLVARYNANGDSGRFAQVLELFAADATMDIGDGRLYRGHDEIAEIFTAARESWHEAAGSRGAAPYVRHFVSTHQIDLPAPGRARGRCYFLVLMAHGPDHWGRYLDEYAEVDGRWLFTHRRVAVDDRIPEP